MINILLVLSGFVIGHPSDKNPEIHSDSLRLETKNGVTVIVHRVEKGETLSAISRRYGAPLGSVYKNNPGAEKGINAGQEVRIPYEGKVIPSKSVPPSPKVSSPGGSKPQSDQIHVVSEKETLYSISRKYQVKVDDIIRWNQLSGSSVRSGQKLIIKTSEQKISEEKSAPPSIVKEVPDEKAPAAEPSKAPVVIVKQPPQPEALAEAEKNESGYALLYERSGDGRKYLAYHRTIPEGTVIRVRNKDNKKEIFVRVAGKLPETESSDVLIRISRAAWEKLGGADRFPAEIIFFE